ncbi:MAG: hypothetical protein RL479_542 [Verrucomicrobiota bacterium]
MRVNLRPEQQRTGKIGSAGRRRSRQQWREHEAERGQDKAQLRKRSEASDAKAEKVKHGQNEKVFVRMICRGLV